MKTSELAELTGRTGTIEAQGLKVRVLILDGKTSYGNARLLITPVDGSGQAWVAADRVAVNQ